MDSVGNDPIYILIAGGSCSGKSELGKSLRNGVFTIKIFSMDDFYKDVALDRLKMAAKEICHWNDHDTVSEWWMFFESVTSEQYDGLCQLIEEGGQDDEWDSFYKTLENSQLEKLFITYDFDHPDAFDWPAFEEFTKALWEKAKVAKVGDVIEIRIPIYSFPRHRRVGYRIVHIEVTSLPVIIGVEGIYALYNPTVTQLARDGVRVFIDTTPSCRLIRRIRRDPARGRTVDEIIRQMTDQVEPAYRQYVEPTRQNALITLPNYFTTKELDNPLNGNFEEESAIASARDVVCAFIRGKINY